MGPGDRGRPHAERAKAGDSHGPHTREPVESGPPSSRLGPAAHQPPALPVLAGRDHSVLLGDKQRGRDGVLVPLDLAQQHRAAALRPGVDLGRHVRAAAAVSATGGPSADCGRAGGDQLGFAPAPPAAWVPRRRKLPNASAAYHIG